MSIDIELGNDQDSFFSSKRRVEHNHAPRKRRRRARNPGTNNRKFGPGFTKSEFPYHKGHPDGVGPVRRYMPYRPVKAARFVKKRQRWNRPRRKLRRARPFRSFRRRVRPRRSAVEKKRLTMKVYNALSASSTQIPGVSALYTALGTQATRPSQWSASPIVNWMDGVTIPQNITNSGRVGSKVNLMHTSLKMSIVMKDDPSGGRNGLPVTFRLIILKVKKGETPQAWSGGETALNPFSNLFWRQSGQDTFGSQSLASSFEPATPNSSVTVDANYMTPLIFGRSLLNKNSNRIYCDKTFQLSPPTIGTNNDLIHPNQPSRPCHKNMYFKLKHNKNTLYAENNLPENYEWRYVTCLFAYYQSPPVPPALYVSPDNFFVNYSGQTLYTDA